MKAIRLVLRVSSTRKRMEAMFSHISMQTYKIINYNYNKTLVTANHKSISELRPLVLCSGVVRAPTRAVHSYHTRRESTQRQNVAVIVSPFDTRRGVWNETG